MNLNVSGVSSFKKSNQPDPKNQGWFFRWFGTLGSCCCTETDKKDKTKKNNYDLHDPNVTVGARRLNNRQETMDKYASKDDNILLGTNDDLVVTNPGRLSVRSERMSAKNPERLSGKPIDQSVTSVVRKVDVINENKGIMHSIKEYRNKFE